ncbi:hypothetical protein M3649_04130 [Ureibacillus chungkukjangi]|uniref:hypothetical protein n=1 Tax=Ureibacillus chungkukjangi TaxID=1202712 RepID=UPI00203F85B2|nr:hypothetical protein [Ureibacillus chungkukjangi]MCM3387321.1 hypothetical protein [Ureibacillus chungkukjangi]
MAEKTDKKAEKEYLSCISCSTSKEKSANYYNTSSKLYANTKKIPLCKSCIKKNINYDDMETIYSLLRQFDIVFDIESWESAVDSKMDTWGRYMSIINSLPQFEQLGWNDSVFKKKERIVQEVTQKLTLETFGGEYKSDESEVEIVINEADRSDVIRLLGYDPFVHENPKDKNKLYNSLIDMLDESTLDDGFKTQASIEIVIGFNQVDKINQAITRFTENPELMVTNAGGVKQLISSKKEILASLIKLAEENGISVKHNTQKSKGAGTLSGIIKTLQEKGIEEGELNLFDIETSRGMRQVADISNESIIKQLQFDENDYTNMIVQQREMIQELDNKVIKLEEENRLIKKELLKYTKENKE